MANQIINVIVNSKGAVTVKKELDAMGDSARQTASYLNGLRAILATALTFSGASAIVAVADNFTVLQNRIRLVKDESETLAGSWSKLMQIANGSYSSIDSTVSLYFRVAQAFKAWGESANEAYKFTELFQKAALLSGSSMQTTAQAVYQFGQALNKGKLDGDEFKSVMEGLPYVASLIEKSLGVTRKELYQMSADGKISVDRIRQAFSEAAATIQKDWKNITPTIGMALVVLQNNWTDFIGSIQSSTGVFSSIAQLILLVANNFTLLAIAMTPVAASLAFLAGRAGLGLVVIGLKDLSSALKLATVAQWLFNSALYANPYVLVAVALAAIVAVLVYFRNEIGLTDQVLSAMWTSMVTAFNTMMAYLTPIAVQIANVVKWLIEWNIMFIAIRAAAAAASTIIQYMFANSTTFAKAFVSYMKAQMAPLFGALIDLAKQLYAAYVEITNLLIDTFKPAIVALTPAFKTVWSYMEPALQKMLQFIGDIGRGWVNIANFLKTNFLPAVKAVFEGWIFIIKTALEWIERVISALRQAIALARQLSGLGGGGKSGGAHYGAQFNAGEGFATGGAFKVGGTGAGRDTTPVAFRAERGERVTVETKKQQRTNDNQQAAANVNVPVSIVNVFDPSMMPAANMTQQGQRSIVNAVSANRDELAAILGVS